MPAVTYDALNSDGTPVALPTKGQVFLLGDGDLYSLTQTHPGYPDSSLVGQEYDRSGLAIGPAETVFTETGGSLSVYQSYPAELAGGQIVIGWSEQGPHTGVANVTEFAADGSRIADIHLGGSYFPSSVLVAPLGNGGFAASWIETYNGTPEDQDVVQTFDASGKPTSPQQVLGVGRSPAEVYAAAGAGGAFLTVITGSARFFDGAAFKPAVALAHPVDHAVQLSDGRFALVGADPGSGSVYAEVYDPRANSITDLGAVHAGSSRDIDSLAPTPDGGFVVGWRDFQNGVPVDPNGYGQARAIGPAGDMGFTFQIAGDLIGTDANGQVLAVRTDAQGQEWLQAYTTSRSTGSGGQGQTFTSPGPGSTFTGTPGDDTFYPSQGNDTLTGGPGHDTYVFRTQPWAPDTITDFKVGEDRLDLSALFNQYGYTGSDPTKDGWIFLYDDGHGGVIVRFQDHTGQHEWPNTIIDLQGVSATGLTWSALAGQGGAGAGGNPGQTLTATGPDQTLTGGPGDDILITGPGNDTLTGNGGADIFRLPDQPWAPIVITDFTPGTDHIDLKPMMAKYGYSGSDPVKDGWIFIYDDGNGGAIIRFDDHTGQHQWPNTIIDVQHVSAAQLAASDWWVH